ncbi:HpcH/HpaI aldolase/citrate lyase family protein [Deinococcus aquatilis]|uniref:HpcH/HpaI aldolase/citrate lyase family protein n=1 Tax=Deinococcus aquatilis TaxID=519440 RepID=UPI000361C0BF|nr:CoA ester lyase [Deinococcus aquatilis]
MIPARLERSQLYVPAHRWHMIEKAVTSPADAVVLDLEDAVPLEEKITARANVIRALTELEFGGRLRVVRMNGLDTPFAYRDLIEVMEAAGERLDLLMLPKANAARDVQFVETLLTQVEAAQGSPQATGVEVQIETAAGVLNVREIAAASPRLEALIFGPGDFAASAQMPIEHIGERGAYDADYPGDRWHHAMQSIVLAAHAHGLRCLDGPYAPLDNPDGLARMTRIARGLGFDGKQCIHPRQLDVVNAAFSQRPEEVAHAQAVVAALREAEETGRGAVSLEGRMVDAANIRMAQVTLHRYAQERRIL